MTDTPTATCNVQLNTMTYLRNLFGTWRDPIDMPSPVTDPRVVPSTVPTSYPMVVPSTPPTSPPIMTCHLTSIPRVSLPTPTPFAAPTNEPRVQTDREFSSSPIVVSSLAPTSHHTSCHTRLTHPNYSDPIAHRTQSRSPIPPPDDGPVSHQTRYGQGLSNLDDAELSPSAASRRQF